METMTALRAHRRGGPEVLVVEQAPIPSPRSGDVLVAVHAAAITFDELKWDLSWTHADGSSRTPVIPSHEFAGVVVGVGDGVGEAAIGREIFGLGRFDRDGAAAEYTVIPVAEVADKPAGVSYVQAAALPLAALTAWQALVEHAHVAEGEHVLIHGAAGGVGMFATQLARVLGAHVTGTVRSGDAASAFSNGAHEVVDIDAHQFVDRVRDVDVVLDTVGGNVIEQSYTVMKPGGRLITLAAPPPQGGAALAGITATFFVVQPDRAALQEIGRLATEGTMRPVISQTFPLADGRAAYESGAAPRPPGKTVLVVREA